jgi:CheY-like chemotaxis protein
MQQPVILVVEDNPTLQKMVALMAKRRGVDALICGTCTEAINAVTASPDRFSLVLMDWSLPDMDGLTCTGILRGLVTRTIPIIAMTGHAMPGDREACIAAGMDDYMTKPFSFDQFSQLLAKYAVAAEPGLQPFPTPTPPRVSGHEELPPTGT